MSSIEVSINSGNRDNNNINKQNVLFIDGPPFPTGTPHLGHITTAYLKNMMIRHYMSKPNVNVISCLGWDCHGHSIENEVDKSFSVELNAVQKINECKNRVNQHISNWKKVYNIIGRRIDDIPEFYTMSDDYKNLTCKVFKDLWDAGYVYQDKKIMLFSFATQTPVSHIDAIQNQTEIDTLYFLGGFKMVNQYDGCDVYILVNTSNIYQLCYHQGMGLNANYRYWLIRFSNTKNLFICQDIFFQVLNENHMYFTKVSEINVEELNGQSYYVPCPNMYSNLNNSVLPMKIINFWNVNIEDDTGFNPLVHTKSEEEFLLLENRETPYNIYGQYDNDKILELYPSLASTSALASVKEKTSNILDIEPYIMQIIQRNINCHVVYIMKRKTYVPICSKTEQRLFNYPVPCWFIKVIDKREQIKERIKDITFFPDNKCILEKWIDDSKDWCISRNRIWGCKIPIYNDIEGNNVCFDHCLSKSEMLSMNLTQQNELVFDSWFESSLVPWYLETKYGGNIHFEKKIAIESVEQHRGWFYTQLVIATLLNKPTPMTHIITHGTVLSESGHRMCKTKNNLPSIYNLINQYGSDYLRIMLFNSCQPRDSFKFKDNKMISQYRNCLQFQKNCVIFLKQNVDLLCSKMEKSFGLMSVDEIFNVKKDYLSHWIIQELFDFQMKMMYHLDNGSFMYIWEAIESIQDNISKWYIKLKKPAFKDLDGNASVCVSTLFWCLFHYMRMCEPIMPFTMREFSRSIFSLNINGLDNISNSPLRYTPGRNWREDVKNLKQIITMAKIIRHQNKHKNIHLFHTEPNQSVKMPIHKLILIHSDAKVMKAIQDLREYIYQEVNAIHIEYLLEESKYIDTQLKLNYKMDLGEYSSLSRDIHRKASNISPTVVSKILRNKENVKIHFPDKMVELPIEYFMLRRSKKENMDNYDFLTHKNLSILIDKEINEEMIYIYEAKLLVRKIQNLRRLGQLVPSDKIRIFYHMKKENDKLKYILDEQMKYIYPSLQVQLEPWNNNAKPFVEETMDACDIQIDIGIEKMLDDINDDERDIDIEFEEEDEVLLL